MQTETLIIRPSLRKNPNTGDSTGRVTALSAGVVLAGALTLATACSGDKKESNVLDSQPGGITLLYPRSEMQAAGVQADEHCDHYGKVSMLIKEKSPGLQRALEDPGSGVFYFACVDPIVRQP